MEPQKSESVEAAFSEGMEPCMTEGKSKEVNSEKCNSGEINQLEKEGICDASSHKFFRVCSECPALLEQVPETLFFGTTHVGLNCFDVSNNYFAFGSGCGAIFMYNRRLNRSTSPLRTHYNEVIVCVRLFSGTDDMLAIGHESGILALLCFPSVTNTSRRKIQQHLDSKLHCDHALTCMEWDHTGTSLYSADSSGVVCVTMANFEKEIFESQRIVSVGEEVIQISYASNYLAVATHSVAFVVDLKKDNEIIELQQLEIDTNEEVGVCLLDVGTSLSLYVGSSHGIVYHYNPVFGNLVRSINLADQMYPQIHYSLIAYLSLQCKIYRYGQNLLYYCHCNLVLLSIDDCLKAITTYHTEDFEVEKLVVDDISELAVYLLTRDKKVFRISSTDAPHSICVANERPREFDPLSLLSSIQKTTKLLPLAPTKAIFDRLRFSGDQALSSLPNIGLASLGSVFPSTSNLAKNSGDSNSDASSGNKNSTEDHEGCKGKVAQSLLSPQNWLQNVNEVSKYVVDVVGGAGIPVREGFFPDELTLTKDSGLEDEKFPNEVRGTFDEVMVQRSTKAVFKRKLTDSLPNTSLSENNCTGLDNSSSIDDKLLDNIRQALTTTSDADNNEVENLQSLCRASEVPRTGLKDGDPSLSTSSVAVIEEQQKAQGLPPSDMSLADRNKDKRDTESTAPISTAYEELVKKALENKPMRQKIQSEEIQFFDGDFNDNLSLFGDIGDIWSEIRLPFPCSTFSVTSNYFLFCGFKKGSHPRYILLSDLMEGRWSKLKQKAELIVMNGCLDKDSLVWRVYNGVAYAPCGLHDGPIFTSSQWHAVANEVDGISEVSLTSNGAWYATNSGQIYAQLMLPEMGIVSRCESPWALRSITASEVAVWALQCDTGRLVVRAGLKHCPFGIDWVEIEPEGPSRLLNVCLFGQTGWGIDSNYCVWFTNGVDFNSPFGTSGIWLQVCSPWAVLPEIIRNRNLIANIRVSSFGAFVGIGRKVYWTSSKCPITGHSFQNIVPGKFACDDSFEMISAASLNFGDIDFVSLCRNNELYLFRLKTRNFNSLPSVPSFVCKSIKQICAAGDTIYVLDDSGCIYLKSSLRKLYPFGADWKLMDTEKCGSPIKSFAVTNCSVWVLTTDNSVYMVSRRQDLDPCLGEEVLWNQVDLYVHSVDQIRASKCGTYVWIYSLCSGRGWVRSCVNSRFPTGKAWLEASSEIAIADLAVGSQVVWSLSSTGQLFKLRGLSTTNPSGIYWKPMPGKLKAISLDARDNLWGLDLESRLVYHKVEVYPSSSDRTTRSLQEILTYEDGSSTFFVI